MTLTIQDLLCAVIEERKKSKPDEDEEFVVVEETNNQWSKLFEKFFLSPTTRLPQTSTSTTSDDDLIFYVTRKFPGDINRQSHSVEVFRHHDFKRRPKLGSSEYDWEETTNLNLVLHQFEYTVTTAVCIKTDNKHLQVLKRLSTRVYASPSRRDMENKGTEERITYPNLYFSVDNFEDAFCEMVVNEGQMVCVELVAKNPMLKEARVLFLGSIKYEALKRVYDTRATTGTRVAQRMTLGMYTKHRVEFVKMRGPNGKGHAEMAVSQHRISYSNETPQKTTLTSSTNSNNADENANKRRSVDNSFLSRIVAPLARQQHHHQNASIAVATSTVDRNDYNQDSTDESNFLGRRLNQAMNWVRGSNLALDQAGQSPPLQTCLTYLTLPCNHLVKDVLEVNSLPLLTL